MVNSRILKWAGLLGVLACLVAVTNCHDFEQALEDCKARGDCFPDDDDDGIPDAVDGCPNTGAPFSGDLAVGKCDPSSKLCLRHECPVDGAYEFSGLWGSSATDMFLAARSTALEQAWFVRFSDNRFTSAQVSDTGFQPWRLHGSSNTNVWAINETATACSLRKLGLVGERTEVAADAGPPVDEDAGVDADAGMDAGMGVDAGDGQVDAGTQPPVDAGPQPPVDAGTQPPVDAGTNPTVDAGTNPTVDAGVDDEPDAGTGTVTCPSPVYRLTSNAWAPVPYGDGTSQLQTPAIFAAEIAKAWAVTAGGDVVRWESSAWTPESLPLGTGAEPQAFWGDDFGPVFAVGTDSRDKATYWQRNASIWGSAATLTNNGPFVAIAGPDVTRLYAATGSEVFKWNSSASRWDLETSVTQGSVQDLWVSDDGTEVWVALKTASVLRKRGSTWAPLALPVALSFSAYRIIGFGTPVHDVWITGTHASQEFTGTIAYHFELQP
jgi:hypothetical protein